MPKNCGWPGRQDRRELVARSGGRAIRRSCRCGDDDRKSSHLGWSGERMA